MWLLIASSVSSPAPSPPSLPAWLRPARLASDVSALAGAACDVTVLVGGTQELAGGWRIGSAP